MRNVLIVARNFAPASHVSVERATKLAKYLPQFGWRPTVLTGQKATVGLAEDPDLLAQVAGIEIIRTRAPEFSMFYGGLGKGSRSPLKRRGVPRRGVLHPKAWLVPDSQVLWYPFAVRAAMRRARSERWHAVVAMSFPPTAILIAHAIAGRLKIPYVIDFRDSWTAYHHAPHRPAPLAEYERRLEARMIRDAAAVVAVDERIVEHALVRIAPADRPPLHVIQNGYDEDDFRGTAAAALPPFSIVHTGQLRRSPRPLWEALTHAMVLRPELRGRVHFWQVGFADERAIPALETPPEGVTVHHVPSVPQREAVSYMLGADLLLVDEFGTIMPSKTLQYLRAARPILAFLDGGGVIREVLRAERQAHLVRRDEPARGGALIASLASAPRASRGEPSAGVAAYSRREVARRFAEVLDSSCDPPDGALPPVEPVGGRNCPAPF
ncbi:MAG: glycosyltransferase [Gemmatimonadales bacterium]|nr:glycosyltransferase [Gemmatimonadales bacterium]MBA3554004.1 glycosyltransferase [Gemmatimonadales bacterium]